MKETTSPKLSAPRDLRSRLVRYRELRPCTTAFIDTRTPGSDAKENFTIIGPGVSENPDQYVHIDLPHGFNIGGARQPPGCVNSQHSHETAEVFIVHTGRWSFRLGEHGDDAKVILEPGDSISIPVHVFRGFENVGSGTGYLFAVLGGDDPGHVTWAPAVFEQAKKYGLVLLENGSLIDTANGETIPPGENAMPVTTAETVALLQRLDNAQLRDCVVTRGELLRGKAVSTMNPGCTERAIIGAANPAEGPGAGKIDWPHGFQLRHVTLEAGAATRDYAREEEEVILLQQGRLTIEFAQAQFELEPGDVMTLPIAMPRKLRNSGSAPAEAFVVRGGDIAKPAIIT